MLVTLVLVVGVIFLFLHNGSATLIPALALPFSILGTFAVMQVLHFSLNNLSMMALILSHRLRRGRRHRDAREHRPAHGERRGAARGVAQGIAGDRLHDSDDDDVARGGVHPDPVHERDPRPAVPRVRGHDHDGDSDFRRRLGDADADAVQPVPARRAQQEGLRRPDGPGVRRAAATATTGACGHVLRHRSRCCCVFVGVLGATVQMFDIIPTGFIPDQDNDSLFVNLQAAQGTSYYDMAKWAQQVADIVIKNPYVDSFHRQRRRRPRRRRRRRRRTTAALMVQLTPRATRDTHARSRSRSRFGRSCCASPASAASSACRRRCRSAAAWATRTSAS